MHDSKPFILKFRDTEIQTALISFREGLSPPFPLLHRSADVRKFLDRAHQFPTVGGDPRDYLRGIILAELLPQLPIVVYERIDGPTRYVPFISPRRDGAPLLGSES